MLGNSVALYNPPVRVAEEMAMLDLLSARPADQRLPGRHVDGHGLRLRRQPGTLRAEVPRGHRAHPQGVDGDRAVRLQRALHPDALRQRVPRPLQQPHPPVWIPGGGSVETWDFCAENDFVYAALSYYGHLMAKETVGGYWRQVEANGKDPNPYRLAFLQFIGVADTDAEAYRLYKEPAEYFFNRSLHVYPGTPTRPATSPRRRRGRATSRRCARRAGQAGEARPHVGRDGREGLRRDRQPRHGARDARGRRHGRSTAATC